MAVSKDFLESDAVLPGRLPQQELPAPVPPPVASLRRVSVARGLLRPAVLLLVGALVTALGFALLHPAPATAAYPFPDVPTSYRYRLQIEVLAGVGVVSGVGGSFEPERSLTRQQFAKMIVLAMRLPVSEADVSPFGDVAVSGPGGLYPDNYVAAAAKAGIVKGTKVATGTSRALFSPYKAVTVAQMVTMASRAAGRPLATPPSTYESVWGPFDPGHGPAARTAQYNGLLRELPLQEMYVWRAATRGEAAALLYNLMGTDPDGITGRFLGTSADLYTFFKAAQPGPAKLTDAQIRDLATMYASYGRRFGLRADLAWAQMVHETGFLAYGGDVLPEQNNYAGIGATGGVPGNSFATPALGVVGHYTHLTWYVYPDHLADPYCRLVPAPGGLVTQPGDPRHFVIGGLAHRGNVRTASDLGGKWAVPGVGYGQKIVDYAMQIPVTKGW